MMVQEHPTPELLTAFGLGKLGDAESMALEAHLAECETCRQALETQAADSFVALARAVRADRTFAEEPGVAVSPGAPTCAHTEAEAQISTEAPPELADHPRYRILGLIGVGGMGAVFKAEHLLMHRIVALKVINRRLVASSSMVERFSREVSAAGNLLSHPNIVHYYDADHVGDTHFLVMEYVEGTTLAKMIAETGALPIAQACDFIRQAALGLQYAFERGMTHRDIKPQNLMVTGSERPVVKILDFGLARLAQETAPTPVEPVAETVAEQGNDTPSGTLTQIGTVMGTPDYIAPEQARDAHAADIRSDIYSLGCTLYDLLTGKPPFPQGTVMQKVIAHLEQTPRPVTELRADVPAELASVVERMLAKDPAQRYQIPADVAEALAPFTNFESEPERQRRAAPSLAHASDSNRRRRPFVYATAATVVLALLASLFLPPVQDFAQTVIRIATNKGVLEIEADDEDLKITIKQTGKEPRIEIVNKRTKRVIELSADGGHLQAKELPDGLQGEFTKFELTRGGKVIFSARQLLGDRAPPLVVEAGFQPLFNGKDLEGWRWKGESSSYLAERDNLVALPVKLQDHSLWTAKSFENYELRLNYRIPRPAKDARAVVWGKLALHVNNPGLPADRATALVVILEANDIPGFYWSDKTVPGPFPKLRDPTPGGWHTLRVVCQNKNITVFFNGQEAATFNECVPSKGHIALWAEGREAYFRNIRIKELPASPPETGFQPLFNGKDLDGWKGAVDHWSLKGTDLVGSTREKPAKQTEYLTHPRSYRDFDLTFQARVNEEAGGGGYAGLVFRGTGPKDGYHNGVLLDLGMQGFFGTLHTGGQGNLNRRASAEEVRHVLKKNDFNDVSVLCVGKHVTVRVNGLTTVDDEFPIRADGVLAWLIGRTQSEGVFRNVRIREIAGFQPLFNGKDLTGWVGDMKTWAWKDGKLVGDTVLTGRETREPSFLVSTKSFRDFELKFRARISNHGGVFSGLRVRSRQTAQNYRVIGPALDFGKDIGGFYTSIETNSFKPPQNKAQLVNALRLGDNDFYVRCQGKRVTIRINGVTTLDEDCPDIPDEGVLAFEVERFLDAFHQQVVTIEDIQLRELATAVPALPTLVKLHAIPATDKPLAKEAVADAGGWLIRPTAAPSTIRMFQLPDPGEDDCWLYYRAKLKTDGLRAGVSPGVSLEMWGQGVDGKKYVSTGHGSHMLAGTTNWSTYEIIFHVKKGMRFQHLSLGLHVHGDRPPDGKIWIKDVELLVKRFQPEPAFQTLFNGKDASNWDMNLATTWKFEDNRLICRGNGGLLQAKNLKLDEFHLRVEARTFGDGAYLRLGPQLFKTPSQKSVIAHQHVMLFANGAVAAGTIGMDFNGNNFTGETLKDRTKAGEWFTLEVIHEGRYVRTLINGEPAAEFVNTEPAALIGLGLLGFHVEPKNGELQIRKVEIKELAATPAVDAKRIQGAWTAYQGGLGGNNAKSDKEDLKKFALKFDGDKLTSSLFPNATFQMSGKDQISIQWLGPDQQIKSVQGTYRLQHDLLSLDFQEVELKEGKKQPLQIALMRFHDELRPLFNGKNLDRFANDSKAWTWRDSKLIGVQRADEFVEHWLWRPSFGDLGDFELEFDARLEGQAPVVVLFRGGENLERTGLKINGPMLTVGGKTPGGLWSKQLKQMLKTPAPDIIKNVRENEFNHYLLRCVGKRVTVQVNGVTTVDDEIDAPRMQPVGNLGWVLLGDGKAGTVTFRDIKIRDLPAPGSAIQPLFNGKDLTGWTGASDSYFVKKDGTLLANPVANEYAMLRTIKSYENYELRLQCKVANEGQAFAKNRAGVALHVTQPAGLSTPRYGIAISLTSGRDPDMKAHGPGDVGEVNSTQKTKGPIAGGWNELRVICQDKKVTIFYNGEERWSCSRCPVSQGQIGLWSLDGEAYFRDIEIRELPPPADAVRLQGQWSLSLAESEGKRLPINGNDLKNMEIHFGATEFEMIAPAPGPGQELIRVKGTYTLDPVKKEIKLKFKELKTPEPVPCSYLLDGDRLTLDMKAVTLSDPPIPEPPSVRFIYMRKAGK